MNEFRRQPPLPNPGAADSLLPSRNNGAPPLLEWVLEARVDEARVAERLRGLESRAASAAGAEVPLLLRALRCIDLTTLSGDDTPRRVRDLCARASHPLPARLADAIGTPAEGARTAAVCVYHHFLKTAKEALSGSGIPVAIVAAGFPAGLSPLPQRIDEIRASVAAGADEIDAVINRSHVLTGEWSALDDEVRSFRSACGSARLKVILATGDLGSLTNVARAARLCLLAGADFIKTSTGKEAVNATYEAGLVMLEAIADYRELTGESAGFKPAGGIRSGAQALGWLRLVEEVLGDAAAAPDRFRIGASGLLGEIVERLECLVNGPEADRSGKAARGPADTGGGY